jgi:hypothetical protein
MGMRLAGRGQGISTVRRRRLVILLSIIKSIFNLLFFNLRFPQKFRDATVGMEDGIAFKIFRHMSLSTKKRSPAESILIVRFKFKRFSHEKNIKLSRIPILMIAGFPGFRDKLWMIDWETDYWQGIYQWDDPDAIERYKKSFVLGIMNKRAIADTISYRIIPDTNVGDYIQSILAE